MRTGELKDLYRSLGITYRQFDHWWRMGWIGDGSTPGSGHDRALTDRQVQRIRLMAELVNAGIRPDVAAKALTRSTTSRRGRTYLRIGRVQITVEAA